MERRAMIARLKKLEIGFKLDCGTQVTDACIDTIAGFPKLEDVWLHDTAVTKAGSERLRKKLPDIPECNVGVGPREDSAGQIEAS
ncbi:MAG TPA: hypothetical protein VJL29_13220 [Thermoguttaceae bacterium]|nr:hypothetical protein [Thermoguttaceae bacterium]